jgi:tRNA (adenine57-N1/adenine58-N1)-methyltransferase
MTPLEETGLPKQATCAVGQPDQQSLVRLKPAVNSTPGIVNYDDLIGLWGHQVFTLLGSSYFMLHPSLSDLLREIKRNTQIMYPKDVGFILVTMGIGPGVHVIEAGTGSGSLTTALAWAVGPQGRVYSYEIRPEMQNQAQEPGRAYKIG